MSFGRALASETKMHSGDIDGLGASSVGAKRANSNRENEQQSDALPYPRRSASFPTMLSHRWSLWPASSK